MCLNCLKNFFPCCSSNLYPEVRADLPIPVPIPGPVSPIPQPVPQPDTSDSKELILHINNAKKSIIDLLTANQKYIEFRKLYPNHKIDENQVKYLKEKQEHFDFLIAEYKKLTKSFRNQNEIKEHQTTIEYLEKKLGIYLKDQSQTESIKLNPNKAIDYEWKSDAENQVGFGSKSSKSFRGIRNENGDTVLIRSIAKNEIKYWTKLEKSNDSDIPLEVFSMLQIKNCAFSFRILDYFSDEQNFYIITAFPEVSQSSNLISLKHYMKKLEPLQSHAEEICFIFYSVVKACIEMSHYRIINLNFDTDDIVLLVDKNESLKVKNVLFYALPSAFRYKYSKQNERLNLPMCETLYQPPELFQDSCSYVPAQALVWSLGVFLHYLTHHTYPFKTPDEIINNDMSLTHSDKKRIQLIDKCLNKNPQERIQLENILNDEWFALLKPCQNTLANTNTKLAKYLLDYSENELPREFKEACFRHNANLKIWFKFISLKNKQSPDDLAFLENAYNSLRGSKYCAQLHELIKFENEELLLIIENKISAEKNALVDFEYILNDQVNIKKIDVTTARLYFIEILEAFTEFAAKKIIYFDLAKIYFNSKSQRVLFHVDFETCCSESNSNLEYVLSKNELNNWNKNFPSGNFDDDRKCNRFMIWSLTCILSALINQKPLNDLPDLHDSLELDAQVKDLLQMLKSSEHKTLDMIKNHAWLTN